MNYYKAIFNDVQVSTCDFNFISDQDDNQIAIEVSGKNSKQTNHIVTLESPSCETSSKSLFSAVIKKSNFDIDISVI